MDERIEKEGQMELLKSCAMVLNGDFVYSKDEMIKMFNKGYEIGERESTTYLIEKTDLKTWHLMSSEIPKRPHKKEINLSRDPGRLLLSDGGLHSYFGSYDFKKHKFIVWGSISEEDYYDLKYWMYIPWIYA